ncbi:MAG: hypothetical protein AUJ52_01850 [Elusimicrobia bacterium CG1_02_63_36]|nr:MAG: hypothetical protein AUJ52_01850 [Elusimicrobia bacterium CG1_02_63_36]PIP82453.1 MAG: hemerythrin [Elusimicrobia bacterium CG22_combo_CG10-13_8_21_14_all_63_91]PJA16345.1 MAG: hemerythrin [Elusimicrobia bacterium CG_4_10_14_0_2_um_filter_63_34]PJB26882.1 MAG: hemerythrin [Elusimicrobia bacterium CG_4_9_14_3_um_filter_62_55]
MKATDTLSGEHRKIEQTLDRVSELCRAHSLERTAIADCLEFIRDFSDKRHHGKEEDRLFPLLVKRGMPQEGGPIGCMIDEHQTGRALIRRAAEALHAGDEAEVKTCLSQFVSLLREHIKKEEMILFRMADQILTETDQVELEKEFAASDAAFEAKTA